MHQCIVQKFCQFLGSGTLGPFLHKACLNITIRDHTTLKLVYHVYSQCTVYVVKSLIKLSHFYIVFGVPTNLKLCQNV